MNDATLLALEFDRVAAVVRGLAVTPLGAAALDRLAPAADAGKVAAALAATSEGAAYRDANGPLALDAPPDLEEAVAALAVDGRAVEPLQLVGLARFLASMDAVRSAFGKAAGGPWPILDAVVGAAPSFEREVRAIRAAVDPEGEVLDDASPKLRTVRERLRRQRNRLRGTLESYLRGRDTAKYLQERVVTERAGRFVLVVRSEHRAAIPGIVHGSSGSGASLFLEPLSTVDINNDIVALEALEAERGAPHPPRSGEHESPASPGARPPPHAGGRGPPSTASRRGRAFSRIVRRQSSRSSTTDVCLELAPEARHPLLVARGPRPGWRTGGADDGGARRRGRCRSHLLHHAAGRRRWSSPAPTRGARPWPSRPIGAARADGAVRASTCRPAPAASVRGVQESVFADIGDEQSIANSLSTFSGHVAHRRGHRSSSSRLPALVLLDELGAGTDPVEGGALAAADGGAPATARGAGRDHDPRRHDEVVCGHHRTASPDGRLRLRPRHLRPDLHG